MNTDLLSISQTNNVFSTISNEKLEVLIFHMSCNIAQHEDSDNIRLYMIELREKILNGYYETYISNQNLIRIQTKSNNQIMIIAFRNNLSLILTNRNSSDFYNKYDNIIKRIVPSFTVNINNEYIKIIVDSLEDEYKIYDALDIFDLCMCLIQSN